MIKFFLVGSYTGYSSWIKNKQFVKNIEDADLIMFTGGEDINPAIYGCEQYYNTYFSERRDAQELEAYSKIRPEQVCIGICRGAQLACALNGGRLIQDVSNHWIMGEHNMSAVYPDIENEYKTLSIPSLHHQMMYPYDIPENDYTLMYVSSGNKSDFYDGDKIDERCIEKINHFGEPEVVLFHKENNPEFLAIQGHPEMMDPESDTINFFNNLLIKLLEK